MIHGCCTFIDLLLKLLSLFEESPRMSLVCEVKHLDIICIYINVKGSQAKEAAEGPDVCFCIKRITGTRQAPGMEKVSQYTVMFYNFC